MFENIKNKKILITGHTGFKGSWLVKILHKFTSHIYGFSLKPKYENSMYEICQIVNYLENEYYDLDISDYDNIARCISEIKPDVIFHLAAQPLVLESYEDPINTFKSNVNGTLNLLEAVRTNLSKCVVICITTDKVYENNESGMAFAEHDKLCGYDPYSASKAMCELLVDSYRKSFFNVDDYRKLHEIQIATCRAGNVIGGGDFSKYRIIVDIVNALYSGQLIKIRHPNAVRPWQHVLEPLYGYIMLADKMLSRYNLELSSAFNFGPKSTQQCTVEDIVNKIVKIHGNGKYIVDIDKYKHESQTLMLNIDKAEKMLNWTPILDIDTALQMTIEWYNAFFNNGNCIDITNKQIANYFDKQSEKLNSLKVNIV